MLLVLSRVALLHIVAVGIVQIALNRPRQCARTVVTALGSNHITPQVAAGAGGGVADVVPLPAAAAAAALSS